MLKLFSLNIEGDCHLDRIIPTIQQEKPDVVCLQEVFLADLPNLERATGMTSVFAPMARLEAGGPFARIGEKGEWGIATLAQSFAARPDVEYYAGSADVTSIQSPNECSRPLLTTSLVTEEGQKIQIVQTHFTWSPDGEANAEQRRDAAKLKELLATKGEFVLCGDLNAPRGKEIFQSMSAGLLDWLPAEIESTLDPELHRRGKELSLAVDALLSTKQYYARAVRVISGMSDHLAIVAELTW